MNHENYLKDAIEPDEAFADAVKHQTRLMAGDDPEYIWDHIPEDPYSIEY